MDQIFSLALANLDIIFALIVGMFIAYLVEEMINISIGATIMIAGLFALIIWFASNQVM